MAEEATRKRSDPVSEEEGFSDSDDDDAALKNSTKDENAIAPPRALYFDRDDVEWDDFAEGEIPQTGTNAQLKHPPPTFINASPHNEVLNKPNPLSVSNPDEYYRIMGKVPPKPTGQVSDTGYPLGVPGKLVYDSIQLNARRIIAKKIHPFYTVSSPADTTLVFDSLFESGNLYQAYQVSEFEYNLILKNDYNTNGHTQWYYFQVSNMRKGQKYKLNIINFYKRSSMYNRGLRPLMYSEDMAKKKKIGWHRTGEDILYIRNQYQFVKKKNSERTHFYHSLQFSVEFPYEGDTCYLAHCFPYTYTDLQSYIVKLEADAETRKLIRRRLLCRTVAGNRCDVITITAAPKDEKETEDALKKAKTKPCIVLSSRVHPGESNASWIMKGCIDFLLSGDPVAVKLREWFIFKIIPMLNPDGVIIGNYRTGLAGSDLNRRWKDPDENLHPTITMMKAMMDRMRDERGISLFVDLHGHSVKNNAFIYGCDAQYWENNKDANHPSRGDPAENESRMFPMQLENRCKQFCFTDCRFHVKKRKETSGRVVAWRNYTNNAFTLEASFGGTDKEHHPASTHFTINDYEHIGKELCLTIADVLCIEDESQMEEIRGRLLQQIQETALPEGGDSDDEGGGGKEEAESDDDSDDDTVATVQLPAKVQQALSSAAKAKKKAAKKKASKASEKKSEPPPVKPREPPFAMAKKSATPRVDLAASERSMQDEKAKEDDNAENTSKCNCPSCQVYEEFIASSNVKFNAGAGRDGSGGKSDVLVSQPNSGSDSAEGARAQSSRQKYDVLGNQGGRGGNQASYHPSVAAQQVLGGPSSPARDSQRPSLGARLPRKF